MPLELPAILGRDASGEVVEVGSGVTRFRPGARVVGLVMGGYAERVVAKDEAWAEVPEGLDLLDAAALPLVTLTGSQLVEESLAPRAVRDHPRDRRARERRADAPSSQRSGVGAKVWAGVRRSQKDAAEALGVDGVVALDDEADCRRLPTLDGIADTVGASVTERLLDRVRPGGVIASVASEPEGRAGARDRSPSPLGAPGPRAPRRAGPRRRRGSARHPHREAIPARADPRGPAVCRAGRGRKGHRPALGESP